MDNDDPKFVFNLTSSGKLLFSDCKPSSFHCRFIRAGFIRYADNTPAPVNIPSETLLQALKMGAFDNKAVFIDHASYFDYPSMKDIIGKTSSAYWDEEDQSVNGSIQIYDTENGKYISSLLTQILNDPKPPDVGISIVFYPTRETKDNITTITNIRHIESIDIVFQPAADGRILNALSAFKPKEIKMDQNQNVEVSSINNEENKDISIIEKRITELQTALTSHAYTVNQSLILSSELPQITKDKLLQNISLYPTPADMANAIQAEKDYLASLIQDNVIQIGNQSPRSPQIQLGLTGFDQFQAAFDALLDGIRPPQNIRPLSGIREFYNLISGDYEMSGIFQQERVMFANVTSSTMSNIVADALNKRVINEFAKYPKWFEPVVKEEDFQTLQDIKWITLAGIGALPTVAEGNPYTELEWDDKKETAAFVKKGGYLGITIEAIDKDDTRKLRAAPAALAQGAFLTLSKAVSNIFTDTSSGSAHGPQMSDTYYLFDSSNHKNLGSSGLSSSSWAATRQAMRDQTEFASSGGSTGALGALTAPKYLLVPNELENTALQILGAAQAGSANYLDNVWAEGDTLTERMRSARTRVIVVDLWTDANDWVAVADPILYPTIGIGYRYGRVPEIFSVANPTSGLMFTNDTMPIKVRFFFAVGAMDHRGLYKHVVT